MSNYQDPVAPFLIRTFATLITLVGVVFSYAFGWYDAAIAWAYLSGMTSLSALGHL